MEKFYKKHSDGSSLVFVIIAVAFVGILGSILLNVTLINIETKGTDRTIKKNFYATETVMDKLNIALENISSEAMKEAYIVLMENYTGDVMNTTDQAKIQTGFGKNYIEGILKRISDTTNLIDHATNPTLPGNSLYKIEKIQNVLVDAFRGDDSNAEKLRDYVMVDGGANYAQMELVFDGSHPDTSKYLVLKNIKVKYVENTGTGNNDDEVSTWITTDIKFSVPVLRFEGGGTYPGFTEYSIIGDEEVTAQSAPNATVAGSLYAGYRGFNITTNSDVSVKRKSANVITRGDVNVMQGTTLTLGEKTELVNVYAKNYVTSRNGLSGSPALAKLNVYANSYIMDDMSLNAPYSDVYFGGENAAYYGYSFNKDNTTDTRTELNSQYSSAILINGKYSSLHMDDDMSTILLGGRAYISRDQQKMEIVGIERKDILMGQSLSVKYDQNYYLVADEHMKDGYENPMKWEQYAALGQPGKIEVLSDEITGRSSGIGKLLKTGTGQSTIPYVYNISNLTSSSGAMVYFYYNFKSQSAADTFYNRYFDKDDAKRQIIDKGYLRFGEGGIAGKGITISPQIALLASSNYMTFENNGNHPGEYKTYTKTIDSGDEDKLKQESIDYALTYKSLRMTLSTADKGNYEPTYDGSDADKTTGYGMTETQEKGNQIFDAIMTVDKNNGQHVFVNDALGSNPAASGFDILEADTYIKAVPVKINDTTYVWAYFVVKRNVSPTDQVQLDKILAYNHGGTTESYYSHPDNAAIVVANCNIEANTSMKGLVISDQTVYLRGGGVTLTAEPSLLREMFRKQRAEEGSKPDAKEKFITYFDAFSTFSAGEGSNASNDAIDISRYITYSNWKKNADEITPTAGP
ncbi:MAG: hypothetical protein K2N51_00795 [Lachnospiraceae bacterium]|nr:hypothetical protein [Lachnospiraceae bacterium]